MCKATQLVGRLTVSERRALSDHSNKCRDGVRSGHFARLIELGLLELAAGDVNLTHTGRRVLALIGDWAGPSAGPIRPVTMPAGADRVARRNCHSIAQAPDRRYVEGPAGPLELCSHPRQVQPPIGDTLFQHVE